MKASDIEKKRLDRLHILYELYSYSTTKGTDLKELAFKKLEIKNGRFESAFNYLNGEKLIIPEGGSRENYKISHEGIKMIEAAILNPEKAMSDIFPPFSDLDIKE